MRLIWDFGDGPDASEGDGIRSGFSVLGCVDPLAAFAGPSAPMTRPCGLGDGAAGAAGIAPFAAASVAEATSCRCFSALRTSGRPPTSGTGMPFTVPGPGDTGARFPGTGVSG